MSLATQDVTFTSGDRSLGAYLAQPSVEGRHPGVVVIHEAYGLNENIREVAERFADQGYAALAVDLFAGRNRAICMASFMGGMLFNALHHRGIVDLKAALTFLADLPSVDPDRLGAIGFCMGGSFAIAWACTDDRLNVIAPFYGMNPSPVDVVARSCPVVGSYPTGDFTTGHARKLDAALDRHNIPHDIAFYKGAKHSFFNDKSERYNPEASADAWQRTLAFFQRYIGQPNPQPETES